MKIAVLSNVIKSNPTEAAKAFLDVVASEYEMLIARELSGIIPAKEYYSDEELFKSADIAVVFGGDGTTLTAARRAAPFNVPVLSINTGHLGFLATVSAHDARKAGENLLKNNLALSERMMLTVSVIRNEEVIFSEDCLNDVVINRTMGRLCKLRVNYASDNIAEYHADGVVISTPTGSTAYSLSCGGPLVLPNLELFIVSPICPHLLGSRPMILPVNDDMEVFLTADSVNAHLSCDGQNDCTILKGDIIKISKAPYKAKLLTLKEQNFFDLVKKKLTII